MSPSSLLFVNSQTKMFKNAHFYYVASSLPWKQNFQHKTAKKYWIKYIKNIYYAE